MDGMTLDQKQRGALICAAALTAPGFVGALRRELRSQSDEDTDTGVARDLGDVD